MSKLDDVVEADDCIVHAMRKTPNLSTDQLIALAQVNATKAVAEELRLQNLLAYKAVLFDFQVQGGVNLSESELDRLKAMWSHLNDKLGF